METVNLGLDTEGLQKSRMTPGWALPERMKRYRILEADLSLLYVPCDHLGLKG